MFTAISWCASPEIVAGIRLTGQTGSIGGTLFTPTNTGLFRVNFYVQSTGGDPSTGQGIFPSFNWTDDNGPDYQPLPLVADGGPQQPFSTVFIIKAVAGQPITWATGLNPTDNSVYEVYFTLERIGPK